MGCLHQNIFTRKMTDITFTSDFFNNHYRPCVSKSLVPTHSSRCPRPLVPVPLLYTAVNKISRKVSGRPTSIKNMVSSNKRGSDAPSRSYTQRSGRKSTVLGYRGRGSYFHDRQQVGGRSAPITSTNTTEGQSVNKVNVHSVPLLQAGSLSGILPKWREFTSDPWILQTVSGYHFEFETTPHQVNLPKFPKFSERETALIES